MKKQLTTEVYHFPGGPNTPPKAIEAESREEAEKIYFETNQKENQ